MKKLYLRMLREIKNNRGQFLSIILVIAIGSLLLAGMFSAISAINSSVDDYYKTQNLADIWSYFSGITDEQVASLNDQAGIEEAQGRYTVNADLTIDGNKSTLRVHSLTDINVPYITQGVAPANLFDCVVDQDFARENDISIGQPLVLHMVDDDLPLTVSGFCIDPEYAFKTENPSDPIVNNKTFGYAYSRADTLIELNKHSQTYLDYREAMTETSAQLDDAKTRLDENQQSLDAELIAFNKQINDTQIQIDMLRQSLDVNKANLDAEYAKYQIVRGSISDQERQTHDAFWASKYQDSDTQYAQLDSKQQDLDNNQQQGLDLFASKQDDLDAGYAKYENNLNDLKTQQMQDVSAYYTEVLFKVNDYTAAETSITDNEHYLFLVERGNQSSYSTVNDSLDPIRTVSYVFPLIFFLVAAVISFISMSKTVENQRTQIAVMQAIGISKDKLRFSYVSYAITCALLGSIVFALIGNRVVPAFLINSIMHRFTLPAIDVPVYIQYLLFPFALATVFSGAATLFAVQKVLKEKPAQAMRPRPPKGSKAILVERILWLWRKLKYSSKLIARNIFLNKTRMALSSIGIIGSVMLLIVGISLNYSARSVVDWAINSMNYDISVTYNQPVTDKDTLALGYPVQKIEMTQLLQAKLKMDQAVDAKLQLIEESSSLLNLSTPGGKTLSISGNSVVIPQSVADSYYIKVGDNINIIVNDQEYNLTVTDIALEYTSGTVYVAYPKALQAGIDTSSKSVLVAFQNSGNTDAAVELITSQEDVKQVNTKDNIVQRSKDLISTVNSMILIILLGAVALSMTVIYNITSINIFEHTREYATLMVLGYYKREVNHLILVENMVLTGFGSIVGIPFGVMLFQYIIGLMSRNTLTFPATPHPAAIALAIILTFAFSLLANILLRSKIKNIVLVEALKGAE